MYFKQLFFKSKEKNEPSKPNFVLNLQIRVPLSTQNKERVIF